MPGLGVREKKVVGGRGGKVLVVKVQHTPPVTLKCAMPRLSLFCLFVFSHLCLVFIIRVLVFFITAFPLTVWHSGDEVGGIGR